MKTIGSISIEERTMKGTDEIDRKFTVLMKMSEHAVYRKYEDGKTKKVFEVSELWLNDQQFKDLKLLLSK